MAIRDMFRGDRDEHRGRDRDRWREEWRDDDRSRYFGGGERDWEREGSQRGERDYGSSGGYGGRESPQYYGQSGRADWGGQDYGRRQEYGGGQRRESQDEYGQMDRWSSGLDAPRYGGGGRRYAGGFYTGESREGDGFRRDQYPGSQYGGAGGRSQYRGSEYGGRGMQDGQRQSRSEGDHRGRGPRGYQRADDRIREDVCECLTEDPYIDASEIEVTVSSGEVTLSGSVNSREEKRRAADMIEELSGVKDVRNNLRVTSSQQTGMSGMQSTQQAQGRTKR